MASLGARLVALSGEVEAKVDEEKGAWLKGKMEEFKLSKGITEDTQPTRDLIMRQICLPPSLETEEERKAFRDPILQWEVVTEGEKLPGWDKKTLPEEEMERAPPSPVDKREFSTGKWLQAAPTIVKEEIFNNNGEIKLPKKEEVLNNNELDDSEVVTVFDSSCVIRYVLYFWLKNFGKTLVFKFFNETIIITFLYYDTPSHPSCFVSRVSKKDLRQAGDRNEGGRGGDRGRGGYHGDRGDRGDRGGRRERPPGPGDYRGGRDRSRSPRYRQREERGDRSQDRSYGRRDSRTSQGYHDTRDARDYRGESSRDRSYGSNGSRYQRTLGRGDRGASHVRQEGEGPSGQVQVKPEAGTADIGKTAMTYKEHKEMMKKKMIM